MSIHLPCFCMRNLFTPPLRESVIYAVFARVSYLRCFCVSQLFTLPLWESTCLIIPLQIWHKQTLPDQYGIFISENELLSISLIYVDQFYLNEAKINQKTVVNYSASSMIAVCNWAIQANKFVNPVESFVPGMKD